jgi:hypothetical protein
MLRRAGKSAASGGTTGTDTIRTFLRNVEVVRPARTSHCLHAASNRLVQVAGEIAARSDLTGCNVSRNPRAGPVAQQSSSNTAVLLAEPAPTLRAPVGVVNVRSCAMRRMSRSPQHSAITGDLLVLIARSAA